MAEPKKSAVRVKVISRRRRIDPGNAEEETEAKPKRNPRPGTTVEMRENQLIGMTIDLAARQIKAGTASSQVMTHFLKLGSTKEKLEKEKLRQENELLRAKTDSLQSAKEIKALYLNALNAMKAYSGHKASASENQDDD